MSRRDLSYVDVLDFLTALGTKRITRSGDEISFSCPSPNHLHGDQTPSARMNVRTTLFICHGGSCGMRGDAVSYLTAFHGLTDSEAQRILEERYGGPERSVEAGGLLAEVERIMGGPMVEELTRLAPDHTWLWRFHANWQSMGLIPPAPFCYMLDRGFTRDTLTLWEIGYDEISDRITIPVRDAEGVLVGFKGRAWRQDQHPKYLIVGDAANRTPRYGFDTYRKSEVVFGLCAAGADRAVICEGELNAIALHEAGEIGAVSVAGSQFSERQAELIIDRFSSAVIYFDGDDAGRHGTQMVLEALSPYMPVSIVVDPPDDAAALGAAALPLIGSAIPSLILSSTVAIMRGSAYETGDELRGQQAQS